MQIVSYTIYYLITWIIPNDLKLSEWIFQKETRVVVSHRAQSYQAQEYMTHPLGRGLLTYSIWVFFRINTNCMYNMHNICIICIILINRYESYHYFYNRIKILTSSLCHLSGNYHFIRSVFKNNILFTKIITIIIKAYLWSFQIFWWIVSLIKY